MKKYFNIWRNNYNSYLALFSYENKKTTSVEHYEYIGTVVSESPKKAIDKFYNDNELPRPGEAWLQFLTPLAKETSFSPLAGIYL